MPKINDELKNAEIISNNHIVDKIFDMTLRLPETAEKCKAGQFVMLYTDIADMLLPRPISICDWNPAEGSLRLVYQAVGKGTGYFSSLCEGDKLRASRELGNGFPLTDIRGRKIYIIGGGVGVPPMLGLAKQLYATGIDTIEIILGFRSNPILTDDFSTLGFVPKIATDDGSVGVHGNVMDILKNMDMTGRPLIFACGPRPMLQALAFYANGMSIECHVSMEERMGCGLGVCVGCVVDTINGYKKVCVNGPVFNAKEVKF